MPSHRICALVVLLLALHLGCISVYQPQDEPLSEASLSAAIRTLEESESDVEMLEDGLQLVAYLYEWREPIEPVVFHGDSRFGRGMSVPASQPIRMLVGPGRDVYLPYASIQKVSARSWPLWAGVEIDIVDAPDLAIEGPLVLEAADVEEAHRLTDAINTIRRVRLLSAALGMDITTPAE